MVLSPKAMRALASHRPKPDRAIVVDREHHRCLERQLRESE